MDRRPIKVACPASVDRDPGEDGRSFAHTLLTPLAASHHISCTDAVDSDANCGSYPRPVIARYDEGSGGHE
jgi:hypothetical protein